MADRLLHINGVARKISAAPSTPRIYVLRNEFGLCGAKLGCGLEQCGACTVLVDGVAQQSCVAPVSQFEGREITTVEGLAAPNTRVVLGRHVHEATSKSLAGRTRAPGLGQLRAGTH